jgi:endonuclease V-like protein UPF0215 family
VTLINLGRTETRTVIVQGGAFGEHQLTAVTRRGVSSRVESPVLTVSIAPGSGETLVLAMQRYVNTPTARHPWQRAGTAR